MTERIVIQCGRVVRRAMNRKTSMLFAVLLLAANSEFALTRFNSDSLQAREAIEVVSAVPPIIPRLAVAARVTTRVVVDLRVSMSGAVESANVVDGHPLLTEPTRSACLGWRFAPAKTPARFVRLTFIYAELRRQDPPRVSILPYRLELPVGFAPFPDTVSYVPEDFAGRKYRCEVHNTPLRRDKVQIRYGLIGFRDGYLDALKNLFPHSETVAYGGCVIDDDSPKYAEILYCPRCRKAEAQWSNDHRKETRYSTAGL
jgi:hypothetical protein